MKLRTIEKNGSESFELICLGIGYVCVKWEHIETRLFMLFSALMTNDHFVDNKAYSAVASHRARMEMVRRLASVRLQYNPTLQKELDKVLEKIDRASTERNQVVHGQVSDFSSSVTSSAGITKSFSGLAVQNSIYGNEYDVWMKGKGYSYNHDDLVALGNKLQQIREQLNLTIDKIEDYMNRDRNQQSQTVET